MPFSYPTAFEMRQLEQELVTRGAAGRLGLQIMPIQNVNAPKVRWRQRDNFKGLQHFRGLDGQPTLVTRVGEKVFEYEPGVFGEYVDVTETELMSRAGSVDVRTVNISVDELVIEADEILIGREFDRIESSIWAILITGTLTIKIAGPNGLQTGYSSTFPIQTYNAVVAWATVATATPLVDFFNVSQLGIGKGVNLGAGATAYMNSVTLNNLLRNQNANDLQGRRAEAGGTLDTRESVNRLLIARGQPAIEVYDEGYVNDAGTYTKFIPDNKVSVIGRRNSGARVGAYQMVRNVSNNFQPGSYRYVIDRVNGGGQGGGNAEKRTPANLEVHRGHNGGPALEYPSAVVVINA